jgi:hypothetical protein
MKEAAWDSCTDPEKMLAFLWAGGRASDRKLRLFAAACCRQVWPLLTHPPGRAAVQVAEQYADGRATTDRLRTARLAAGAAAAVARNACREAALTAAKTAAWEARVLAADTAWEAAGRPGRYDLRDTAWDDASRTQCAILRDLFGSPFHPLPPLLKWSSMLLDLAQAAYNERQLPEGTLDPARLAVLADALEEAGAGPEILEHLRGPGPHYRGCVDLDAVLGES